NNNSNGNGYNDVFVSKLDGNLSADISCAYSISPTSQSFSASGGTGSVEVTASSSSCSWTAVSNAAWITVTSGGSGTGNGTVAYAVSPNTSTSPRTGTMTITGQTFTVTQGGVTGCTAKSITAAHKKITLTRNGSGNVTITVKGAADCLVEGVTVTATIKGTGKRLVTVSPGSQETDANGQAVFAITAKDKKGTAVLKFKASGLSTVATVQVKVR
ncbi:MAG: BACON domain-containing protein, partial [Elusimicrobiota bacterium]